MQDLVIDWSKAPEGATHFLHDSDEYSSCWLKYGFAISARNAYGSDKWTSSSGSMRAIDAGIAIPRPSTPSWSGEGLPPVGVVCEYRSGYVEQPFEYAQCEIIAHFEGEQGKKLAAFKYTAHDGVVQLGRGMPQLFRPIRTPEQIAADEREAAIDQMVEDTQAAHGWSEAFGMLHDKGYRKEKSNE